MKKTIMMIAAIGMMLLSCKKEESKSYEIKIVASGGSSYTIQATDQPSATEYLNKIGLSGNNTLSFQYISKKGQALNIRYATTGSLKLKIYKNSTLSVDETYMTGNGIINP